MTFEQIAVLSVIFGALILFIRGKPRYDVVALITLAVLGALKLVPKEELFSGFSNPAVIMVAAVLILSHNLTKSGLVEKVSKFMDPIAHLPSLHIAVLVSITTFISMFMNNIGALALMMPVAVHSTVKAGRSAATVLMPLSFGSLLGGIVTLIGTPPNIIISAYRKKITGEHFTMFDFTPVGGLVAIAGVLYLSLIGWRLLKVRKPSSSLDLFNVEGYLFEIKIKPDSPLLAMNALQFRNRLVRKNISLVSIIHQGKEHDFTPKKSYNFNEGDLLILEGAEQDISDLAANFGLELMEAGSVKELMPEQEDMVTMEMVVASGCLIENRTVAQIRFKRNLGVSLLAIFRQSERYQGSIRKFRFKAGDVLLIYGKKTDAQNAITKLSCHPFTERKAERQRRKNIIPSLLIFACAIMLASFNIIPIHFSLGLAVISMAVTGIIPIRELYEGIDLPIIVLLAALIPIGTAMENSGTTALIAKTLLDITGSASPVIALTLLLLATMALTDFLNNAATAILMAPIAADTAHGLGVSVDPFLIAVAIGSSCAFLTPIGHQNNVLIMGPGGYKFKDYWKMGLPLEIIIVATTIPLITFFWPF